MRQNVHRTCETGVVACANGHRNCRNEIVPCAIGHCNCRNEIVPCANGHRNYRNEIVPWTIGHRNYRNEIVPWTIGHRSCRNEIVPRIIGHRGCRNEIVPRAISLRCLLKQDCSLSMILISIWNELWSWWRQVFFICEYGRMSRYLPQNRFALPYWSPGYPFIAIRWFGGHADSLLRARRTNMNSWQRTYQQKYPHRIDTIKSI